MFEGFSIATGEYLQKLAQPKTLATVIALVVLTALLIAISRKRTWNTKLLAYGALAVSIAFVLSYVRLFKLPYGGTITLASMLPIFVYSYIAGPRLGMLAGLCYGFLQFMQDPFVVHPVQFLLDYPLAFGLLGLVGYFKKNMFHGALVGGMLRFLCHFLSGVVFFGSYAPAGQSVYMYSFLYNITYMLPDIIICVGILAFPGVRSVISRIRAQGAL